MRALRRFARRFAASLRGRGHEHRLRAELEAHLEMQTAENIRAGLAPVEAARQARLKLGAVETIAASYRDEQSLPVVDDLRQDVRQSLRQFRRAPLFTLTATLSLAMGIGASAGAFTVIERLLLRPLPVSDPQQLVYVTDERVLTQASPRFSYPLYAALRDNGVLQGVAARFALLLNAAVNGEAVRVRAELVSGSYFDVVGAAMQAGRSILPDDDRTPGAHPVAVISDGFWRRALASDPSAIGRTVPLNQQTFTIVGIASQGFTGTDVGSPTDVWIPMMMQRAVGRDLLTEARTNWLELLGRVGPGMTLARGGEELTRHLERRAATLQPGVDARRLLLVRGDRGRSPARSELGPALAMLGALTTLALALACINVASLVAVRSAGRQREVAIRLALGARRSRLARQLLTEGVTLAAMGGAAGLLIAPWCARLLIVSQPGAPDIDTGLDGRTFLFTLVTATLTGLLVAQAPILAVRRVGIAQAFDRSFLGRVAWRRVGAHDVIVTLQIAMALAMLVSGALLVQSLRSLTSVNPGFRAGNLLLVSLDARAAGYDAARVDGLWRETLQHVRRVPGVQSVSLAGTVPLARGRQRQPWQHPTSGDTPEIDTNFVGSDYFRTLAIPLLRGREFDDRDDRTSRPVVIVNELLARLFWQGQDPIGKGVRLPGAARTNRGAIAEVVGVVSDVKYRDLRGDAEPMFYRPVLQTYSTDAMTLHVRAAGDPYALVGAIRAEVQGIDRDVPVFQISTLEEQLDVAYAQTRQAALLSGVFGAVALLLSAIGVYGVTALAVRRRTRDIGIRMALGARSRDVIRATGTRTLRLVMTGIGLGVLGSVAFARATAALLFGVTTADTVTFAAMAALLALVSLVAIAIPMRTATRLDAVAAIRHE